MLTCSFIDVPGSVFVRYGVLMRSLSEGESRIGSHYDVGDKRQCVGLYCFVSWG